MSRPMDTLVLVEAVFIAITIGGGYFTAYPIWLSKRRVLNNIIYGVLLAAMIIGIAGVVLWPFYWWFNGS